MAKICSPKLVARLSGGGPPRGLARSPTVTHQEEVVDLPVGLVPLFCQLLRAHLVVVVRLSSEGSDQELDELAFGLILKEEEIRSE